MILLTRPDGTSFWINVAHIVAVEPTPDTIITLFGGEKLRVKETALAVSEAAFAWFDRIGRLPVVPYLDPAHGRPQDPDKEE